MHKLMLMHQNGEKHASTTRLAEYINLDATVVRLLWALLACSGAGLVAYIICAVVIPEKPDCIEG